jgi:hypothetical protein
LRPGGVGSGGGAFGLATAVSLSGIALPAAARVELVETAAAVLAAAAPRRRARRGGAISITGALSLARLGEGDGD